MTYVNIQMKYQPKKQGETVKAQRSDNGEWVRGECFFWTGRFFNFVICENHHERISHGHKVNPFTIEQV